MKKIYIEITNICNLNCAFCPKNERDKQWMSIEQFEIVLNKIKDYTNYINLHVMGEPLVHPNLDLILEKANEQGFLVNLTTNGRLLNKQFNIINQAKSIRQINVSLHSFDTIEEQIRIIELIDKFDKDKYISLRLWTNKHNNMIINYLENQYKVKVIKDGIKLGDNIYLNKDIEFKWPDINNEIISDKGTCYGLRDHIGILVDGSVVPCCLDYNGYNKLGNIFKEELVDILAKEKAVSMKKGFENGKLINEMCKRCGYVSRFRKD